MSARGKGSGGPGARGNSRGTFGIQKGRGGFQSNPQVFRPSDGDFPSLEKSVDVLESKLVATRSETDLDVAELSLGSDAPFRPGYCTRGGEVVLWTNYFEALPRPDVSLFRYHLEISPEVQNRRLRARIIKLLLEDSPVRNLAPGIVSDYQANIISTKALTADQRTTTIRDRDEDNGSAPSTARQYRLRLQETGSFVIADLIDYLTSSNASAVLSEKAEILQALNIILNSLPKTKDPRSTLSTRSNVHFSVSGPRAERFNLGAGLEAWRGYFTSVRTGASRLLVNVQIKHAAMYKAVRLDELMNEFIQQNGKEPFKLNQFLSRVVVDRLHLKSSHGRRTVRPKTIHGLATPYDGRGLPKPPKVPSLGATAKQVSFYVGDPALAPLRPNSYITVFEYIDKVHKISANAVLPVINVGTREHPSYLPPEVCLVVPAQPAVRKLSPNQTAQMIRFAVRKPFENARSITDRGLIDVGLTTTNPVLTAFGLQVHSRMLAVKGRILPTPGIRYAGNRSAHPRFGAWDMGNLTVSRASTVRKWSVLWLRSQFMEDPWKGDRDALISTVKDFHRTLNDRGMRVSPPMIPGKDAQVDAGNDELAITAAFHQLLARNRQETLLLVILPRRDDRLYNYVKQCGDVRFGIHTVCVVASKFAKSNNVPYFTNVALKVNLKLGGTNQTLDAKNLGLIARGTTMIVGIDVTHPSPGSVNGAPSVAAMVASVSQDIGQFPAILRTQKSRQEMVNDLGDMLKSRLRLWQKHNQSQLPENILVYRDGVSEGQYHIVLDKEMPLLREACDEVYPAIAKNPAISIIIAGKRHSTRFYPTSTDKQKMDERSSNPKHGTVVDRGITEPRIWDFFLQAHAAPQGTARPAHYIVIHDEIFRRLAIPPEFANASDVLIDLTHNLCYMFGRANKAVSYCPPAYYADMACERGRCYLSHLFSPAISSAGSTTVDSSFPEVPESVRLHEAIKDSMFYI